MEGYVLPQNLWKEQLKDVFYSVRFASLLDALDKEYNNYTVFPKREDIFSALLRTDFCDVKVCIIGQDPYHNEGQANGLAFAVNKGTPFPPSLKNILKELSEDLGVPLPKCGTLTGWARQGVLLLNSTLTVRQNLPTSHSSIGWEEFTDAVIQKLSDRVQPVAFLLWGNFAIKKARMIAAHHYIIKSAHPSPLSAHNGFFGSKPFSRANYYLVKNGDEEINWQIVD